MRVAGGRCGWSCAYTPDSLTGSTSNMNYDGERKSASERAILRSNGLDFTEKKFEAAGNTNPSVDGK